MFKSMLSILTVLFSFNAQANELSIDQQLDQILMPIAKLFTSIIFFSIDVFGTQFPLIELWLVIAAAVFTFYFGFINISGIKHSCKVIQGDFSDSHVPGEVSHFQALTTALSGTVGLANIAGVAIAMVNA